MPSGKKPVDATQRIESIHSDADLDEATRELCALMSAKATLSKADEERFQHLVNIVEAYEDVHYPIGEPSHAALLEHLLRAKQVGPKKLANSTGISIQNIKAILDGKRQIWPQEARVFSKYFAIEPTVFEPEPDTLAVIGIVIRSGSSGVQASGWFQVKGHPTATTPEPTNGPSASLASIIRFALQQADLASIPLVGLKS